jgi:hypothetical protein
MRCTLSAAVLVSGLGLALCTGCGSSGPTRHEVTGAVTFDGQPVNDGVIQFLPQDGQGSSDGSSILRGEYRIPRDKGLFPGKYKVAITVGDGLSGAGDAGVKAGSAPRPAGLTPGVERAPPEWNTNTRQVVEVTADGPNKFDFHIPRRKN